MPIDRSKLGLKDIFIYGGAIVLALALIVFAMQGLFPPKAQDVKIVSTPRVTEIKVAETYKYDEDGKVQADGGEGFKWSCEGSPSGMSIDKDGLIQWSPSKSGLFDLKVRVTNASDRSDKQEWKVKVIGPPVIKDPGVLKCKPKKEFKYTLEDLSYPKCDTFEIVSDSPPEGLTLDAQTGEFRWTPAETGEHTLRVKAENAAGAAELDVKFRVSVEIPVPPEPLVKKAKRVVKDVKKRREERNKQAEKDKAGAEKRDKGVRENPKKDATEAVVASVKAKKTAEKRETAAKKDEENLKNVEEQITKTISKEKKEDRKKELKEVKKLVQDEEKATEKEIKIRKDESDLFRKKLDIIAEQKKKQVEERVQAEKKKREKREKEAAEINEEIKVRKDEHKKTPEKQVTVRTTEQLDDYRQIKKFEADAQKQAADGKLKVEENKLKIIVRADPDGVPKAIRDAIGRVEKEKAKAKKEQEELANRKVSTYEDFKEYRESMKEKDRKKQGKKPNRESTLNGKKLLHDGVQHYSTGDAERILKKKDLELILVWYDNQIPDLMEAFTDLGCAFTFTPPGGVTFGREMFLVEGKPESDSKVRSVSGSDFFGNYSMRYMLLTDEPGTVRQKVEQDLLKKVKQMCPECGSYEMKLFVSYPFYARVLDEAKAFAAARALDLEKDVARVRWMLKKWGADYRFQVVSVESFDGRKFATDE